MPLATLLLPLLAQIGPGGALPQAPLPVRGRKAPSQVSQPAPPPAAPQSTQLQNCLQLAMEDPSAAIDEAEGWLAAAKTPSERAGAKQCKAMALTRTDSWDEAAALFLSARDDTAATEPGERARLGALAGNALLVTGHGRRARCARPCPRRGAHRKRSQAQRGDPDRPRPCAGGARAHCRSIIGARGSAL